jgi:hypothetical protein
MLKKFVTVVTTMALSLIFSINLLAQGVSTSPDETTWQDLMMDPRGNFYDIQQKFEQAWAGKEIVKGKGYKQFKRWEDWMTPRVYPSGELPAPDAAWQAIDASPQMFMMNQMMAGDWTYIGNTSVPTQAGGAGRINSVRELPGSTTTFFACAPAGGLWKTTNSGTSWTQLNTDFLPSIGISDIAIDPNNTNIMYIATGDGEVSDTYSAGVWKTTDAGATWNPTGLNWVLTQTRTTSRLVISPADSQTLIAATSNGIYKTTNGGTTWAQVLAGSYKDMAIKPGTSDTYYVTGNSDDFYRSTNTGTTWTQITTGLPTTGVNRMSLAVTPANPNYIYIVAGASAGSSLFGVYRSTDSGLNWTQQHGNAPNLLGYSFNGSDAGGQSWYDLRIVASPTNADEIYTGGVNAWKSTNGGTSFSIVSHWYGDQGLPYVHADIHAMYWVPGTTRLIIGCDGGVFTSTNNGTTFTDISSNLPISMQYRLSVATTNSNRVLTGWQDNGTVLKNGSTFFRPLGGDGMECAISSTDQNVMYGEIYYGSISKSTNGGVNWSNMVASNGTNQNEQGAWVTPYVLGNNPNHIFLGKSKLYRSTNAGSTWTASAAFGAGNINDLAIAPTDNNIIYASKSNSLYKSTDGVNFTLLGGGLPNLYIKDIAISGADANKVWVVYSGYSSGAKVYFTNNGGTSWTNITGTLPNLPCNAIVYQNGSSDGIYVGMDIGVFYRDNILGSWVPYMNALPNVPISELEIHYGSGTITAATYGRGTWRAPVYALPTLDAVLNSVIAPTGTYCGPSVTPQIEILNAGVNTITSMSIQYQVNGQSALVYNWTGSLATGISTTISLPSINYGTGSFNIGFNILSVNGVTDDNTVNNSGLSSYVTTNGTNNAILTILTDCYPNETTWNITNSLGTVVFSGGGYASQTTNNIPLCLANECYTLNIFDSYGDGLSSGGCANGNYYVTDVATGNTIVTMTVAGFGFSTAHSICYPLSVIAGCMNSGACNYNPLATIDDGTCTFGPTNDLCAGATSIVVNAAAINANNSTTCSNGANPNCGGTAPIKDVWYKFLYTGGNISVTTSAATGTGLLTDTRIAVYSSCGGTMMACNDDIGGTNYYSNINLTCNPLVIGQTYYIQAGGYLSTTGAFKIAVTKTEINGCTNPVATNYNACATFNDGSCIIPGCTSVTACNYNPAATTDNGTCIQPVVYYRDLDGDTFGNPLVTLSACSQPAGYVTNNTDCNDNVATANPAANEVCNGIDDDCDGLVDEGFDNDSDGYTTCAGDCNDNNSGVNPGIAEVCNNIDDDCDGLIDEGFDTDNDAYTTCEGDCNNNNAAIHPGATEICNNIDDDCDGQIDEGFDNDSDGYSTCEGDCNDSNDQIFPGAPEACNGIDDNCDGFVDNGVTTQNYYTDADNDGFGSTFIVNACSPPAGNSSLNNFDCNDGNPSINPLAAEVCNNIDDDCDGLIDEGFDNDNDSYTTCEGDCNDGNAAIHPNAIEVCNGLDDDCDGITDEGFDVDNDSYTTCEGDCNDNNAAVRPNATEICNGIDDDCDGDIDEGSDIDNDGYSVCQGDCNDNNAAIHPGANEICNGIDDDCDGLTDEGFDADGDGYTICNGDCNNNNAAIHPGATEICNNIDDDCDGLADEVFDTDNDGFTTCEGDCNNNNAAINPAAIEICNGIDDDCDGLIDEGFDLDGDGFTQCNGDCNDNNAAIHPGALEICNNIDDNCDGLVDNNVIQLNYYLDNDGDGFGSNLLGQFCAPPANSTTLGGDCNDNNTAVNPGETEICANLIDDDCDGNIDEGCGGNSVVINDNRSQAILITNSGNAYPTCSPLQGTCVGATVSAEGNNINAITGEDVWYKFVAPSPGVRIVLTSPTFNSLIELQDNIGNQIDAENINSNGGLECLNYVGLTEGNTYFVAIRNYNSASGTGTFTICVQALLDSRCAYGPGIYPLCQSFKALWTGANSYTYRFQPGGGNPMTSMNGGGHILLSSAQLALQYGGTYNATVDGVFNLTNGLGNMEIITIPGVDACPITIGLQNLTEVKATQTCPATVLRSQLLSAKPFVCGAVDYEFEFTETNSQGIPNGLVFTKTRGAASPYLQLNFTSPMALVPGGYYSVRIRPILAYGSGVYGASKCIQISATSNLITSEDLIAEEEFLNTTNAKLDIAVYPNPNTGELINLNLVSEKSGFAQLNIFDGLGRMVFTQSFLAEESTNKIVQINKTLQNGIYTVQVIMNGNIAEERMLIEK